MLTRTLFASLLVSALAACGTSADPVGSMTVGAYTFDIKTEGSAPAAGSTTTFVVKPTAGGMPTSITGWIGTADDASPATVLAVYDPNDGDFDDDMTLPSPLPPDAMFCFDVATGDDVQTGCIAFQKT